MTCPRCNDTRTIAIGKTGASMQCTNCIGPVKYAGIGSRSTPLAIVRQIETVAMQLAMRGYVLRSGAGKRPLQPDPETDSADLAFERGCDMMRGPKVIRTATIRDAAINHARQYHPNWSACDENAQALHARNSLIMCGDWLDDPVSFVTCWTPGGVVKGGTGQSLRIAAAYNIPVFNFAVTPVAALWEWLG